MFNRNPPQHPPQQPPPGQMRPARSGYPPNYPDPQQHNYPPPAQQRRPHPQPQMRELRLRPAKSPSEEYTFRNLVAVSPQDIPPSRDGFDTYVLVNGAFVFSARPLNGFPPGSISMNDFQRTWARIALTDEVSVRPFDPFAEGAGNYLGTVDMDIGFAGRSKTDIPYDQDELANEVIRAFENQIFSPGQQMVIDVKAIKMKLSVRAVQIMELGDEKGSSTTSLRSDPDARGILTRHSQINFTKDARTGADLNLKASKRRPATNAPIKADFKFEDMGIGGLSKEFGIIFRRAFASRVMPYYMVQRMGIQHVRGMLLYGPPGTGKTLIARQIGKMLNAREPKIINGPEVLNKFVGQSEENIRKLFADAEKEQKEKGDESDLHIIIFDELDAVCKQRGSGAGGGTGVGDSVVNQLLSKMDGVDQLNNILLIGMTNRKDMIDDALLRPGRLEIHVEISLPDEKGRQEILGVHTSTLRKNDVLATDVDILELAAMTKNFSGAELSGLVRAATSFAMHRQKKSGALEYDFDSIKVAREDFVNALDEIQPAFGVSEADLERCIDQGIIPYSPNVKSILDTGARYVSQIRNQVSTTSLLLYGPSGSGKTALAARIALDSGFPFVKVLRAYDMDGFTELGKVSHISRVFADAHKSALSVVVIDGIEKIIDWSPIGPRFSNIVLSSLMNQLTQPPPEGRHMLVLATTSRYNVLSQLDVLDNFKNMVPVPNVADQAELYRVLDNLSVFEPQERKSAVDAIGDGSGGNQEVGVGIKYILDAVADAREASAGDHVEVFAEHVRTRKMQRLASAE